MAAERKGKEGRGRGFASMDENKQREIARKGGRAAHRAGTAHEFSSEEAAEAGRKGGLASGRRRAQLHEERERQRQMESEGNREQEMQSETDMSDAESDQESGFEESSSASREDESERRPPEPGLDPGGE